MKVVTHSQSGWPEVPLRQLLSGIEAGKSLRCEERPPKSYEKGVIKVSSVSWGAFDKTQSKTFLTGYDPNPRSIICNGDFLISRANTLELVGACVIVEDAPDNLYLSDKVLRLVLPDDIKPWLMIFLRSSIGRARIEAASTGNQLSMRNIGQEALRDIRVPLPGNGERHRIVAKIDNLSAKSKRSRDHLDHVSRLVEKYKQAILTAAFRGDLTHDWRRSGQCVPWSKEQHRQLQERRMKYLGGRKGSRLHSATAASAEASPLHSSWFSALLADVGTLQVGYAYKSKWYSKEGVKLLRGANIAPGRVTWHDEVRLPPERAAEFSEFQLNVGDIVIAMDRPIISTGLKVARIDEADAGSLLVQRVARYVVSPFADHDFIWHLINSRRFIDHAVTQATGSDLPHISSNDILTTPVPLPPIAEQREVARQVTRAFTWIDRLASEATNARKLIDHLDQTILAKAFRGELVPQDPNDEPASVLLERIKTERASDVGQGRKRSARAAS